MHPLNSLNAPQKEAAEVTSGPLLIVAGAGAGKTKTITHRIAHLIQTGVHPRNILAVTFTNKAATEMRERIRNLLSDTESGMPLMTTFHALSARLLREFHEEAKLPRGFVIWDRDDSTRTIKKILKDLDMGDNVRGVLSVISRKKGEGLQASQFAQETKNFKEEEVARVWAIYDKIMRDEGAVDFDDLLLMALTLVSTNAEVRAKLQNRWTHITIDEYQDTNKSQYEIARLLAGDTRNLCVVGDMDQCIYSWRGAQLEHLLEFEDAFPGAKVVTLEQNYRSTRTILTAANAVIVKNERRRKKNLFTENGIGEPIGIYPALNETDEAWFVAQVLKKHLTQGTQPKNIAILYRENFQSRAIEEALLAFDVPYTVLGVRFFERAEVKDTLSWLRASYNQKAKADLARIITAPPRGIGKVTLDKWLKGEKLPGATGQKIAVFEDILKKIRHAIETLPASEAVRVAFELSGLENHLKEDQEEGKERIANVRELINLAVRYDSVASPEGIERLLEEAALQSEQDGLKQEGNSVSLMTVHASKGLEFEVVFVTGLEQGLFPSMREGERDPEEERRLFYVAVTRARHKLYLSYAQERMKYGSRERGLPSEFFNDIDDRLCEEMKPKRSLLDDNEFIIS